MRRYPITRWSLIVLSALFVVAEVLWIVERSQHPCDGCVDDGGLMAMIFTFVAYVLLLVPVAVVAVILDAIRRRRRLAAELAPQRPDGNPAGSGV